VKIATEGALFGSIRAHGFLQDTVIISDGAGQFRLADHALCSYDRNQAFTSSHPPSLLERRAQPIASCS
jgi:hypothetical protein